MDHQANPYGWPTPLTDEMLTDSLLPPLPTPEESIAERLVMLAHLPASGEETPDASAATGQLWVTAWNPPRPKSPSPHGGKSS